MGFDIETIKNAVLKNYALKLDSEEHEGGIKNNKQLEGKELSIFLQADEQVLGNDKDAMDELLGIKISLLKPKNNTVNQMETNTVNQMEIIKFDERYWSDVIKSINESYDGDGSTLIETFGFIRMKKVVTILQAITDGDYSYENIMKLMNMHPDELKTLTAEQGFYYNEYKELSTEYSRTVPKELKLPKELAGFKLK